MAVIEKTGFLKSKDQNGNINLIYPITTKDNVDGMDEVDEHIASEANPHKVFPDQIGATSYLPQTLTEQQKVQARANIGAAGAPDSTVTASGTNPVSGAAVAAYVSAQLAAITDYEGVSF